MKNKRFKKKKKRPKIKFCSQSLDCVFPSSTSPLFLRFLKILESFCLASHFARRIFDEGSGCLGCPKPENWQRGDVLWGWSSNWSPVSPVENCGLSSPWGWTVPSWPCRQSRDSSSIFILNLPKLAQIQQFLCFGWSICCSRNRVSPWARIKNKLLSKQQISPSSQFYLLVYIMKKGNLHVLPQSIPTTLRVLLPCKHTLQGSKSLRAAGGLNRNVSVSSSSQHFLHERTVFPPSPSLRY